VAVLPIYGIVVFNLLVQEGLPGLWQSFSQLEKSIFGFCCVKAREAFVIVAAT
jgi:hypothetical protein